MATQQQRRRRRKTARIEDIKPSRLQALLPISNVCQITNCQDKATKQIRFKYGTKLQLCEEHLLEILTLKEKEA